MWGSTDLRIREREREEEEERGIIIILKEGGKTERQIEGE